MGDCGGAGSNRETRSSGEGRSGEGGMTYTTTVEIGSREYEIEVEYSYRPGSRATRDHPGDGPEVEVEEARLIVSPAISPAVASAMASAMPPWHIRPTT